MLYLVSKALFFTVQREWPSNKTNALM